MPIRPIAALLTVLLFAACASSAQPEYDLLIRNGQVFDGTGSAGVSAAIAVRGDRIVAIGPLQDARARLEVDAKGLAVAPGFINMLSWADEPLLVDGRSQSDIRQGVTLEVFGEGWSMGPLNARMKEEQVDGAGRSQVRRSTGRRSASILEGLQRKGISPNVASFVGATTVRIHEIGYDDREPTARRTRADEGTGAAGACAKARLVSARR